MKKANPFSTPADRLRCVLDNAAGLDDRTYTVSELAELLGVEPERLNRILEGKGNITLALAFRIKDHVKHYTVMWLIGGNVSKRKQFGLSLGPFDGQWELIKNERLISANVWQQIEPFPVQTWIFTTYRTVTVKRFPGQKVLPPNVQIIIDGVVTNHSWMFDKRRHYLQIGAKIYYLWRKTYDVFIAVGQDKSSFNRYTFSRIK